MFKANLVAPAQLPLNERTLHNADRDFGSMHESNKKRCLTKARSKKDGLRLNRSNRFIKQSQNRITRKFSIRFQSLNLRNDHHITSQTLFSFIFEPIRQNLSCRCSVRFFLAPIHLYFIFNRLRFFICFFLS